ncbi:MAG: hypothetical protein B6I24_01955 [Bacteroidetes bacterium 4572_128]|nr:MAG: hypothetical protein B6I24_01955 [Bacteroidetes bacterium 4572_128]
MKIKILIFGELKKIFSKDEFTLENVKNINQLKKIFFKKYESFEKKNFKIAVNEEIILENVNFKNGDEIAFLPIFSGG